MGLALFHGTLKMSSDPIAELDSTPTESLADHVTTSDITSAKAQGWKRSFVEVASDVRPLFQVKTGASIPEVAPLDEPVAPQPVLKGIVGGETGPRAVFLAPGTGAYVVVGVGETIAGYDVVAVESGQVSARSADGEVTFYLRGAGENP